MTDTAGYYKTPQLIITIRTPQSIAKFNGDNFTIGALLKITTGFTTHDSCYKSRLITCQDHSTHVNVPARKKIFAHYKNIL